MRRELTRLIMFASIFLLVYGLSSTDKLVWAANPSMSSPAPGSELTAQAVTFQWNAGDGVDSYWLGVATSMDYLDGTITDMGDIYGQSAGTTTSAAVTGIPIDGNTIYVRLWWDVGGAWSFADYTYTTLAPQVAITSPAPGSELTAQAVTFQWNAGDGVDSYWLGVATSLDYLDGTITDMGNIYGQTTGTTTSAAVTGIPLNGNTVYVRLWWDIGGNWYFADYTYTTLAPEIAITNPLPGSDLTTAAVTFEWNGAAGVDTYQLGVGTSQANIDGTSSYGDIHLPVSTTNTSETVTGIPLGGNTIYVRLWWSVTGIWFFQDYTYSTSEAQVSIVSPAPGSDLTTPTVTFEWNGVTGIEAYQLGVGTSQSNIDGTSSYGDIHLPASTTSTSQIVTNIPLDGNTLYVRLWWSIGGVWSFTDYTYTTSASAITSPTPGSTLTSSTVDFQWAGTSGVDSYWLGVATSLDYLDGTITDMGNIYGQSAGTNTSATVTGIPINGNTVYVRLWWNFGDTWFFADHTYGTLLPQTEITTPAPGSTLTTSIATFQWDDVAGIEAYQLGVGTSQANIDGTSSYGDIHLPVSTTNTSETVTGIPLVGNAIYVRLWWSVGGTWHHTDYTYLGLAPAPAPVAQTGETTDYGTGSDGNLQKGVEWPNPRFTDNLNGTITDNLTNLILDKNANRFGLRSWSQALTNCNQLADNGGDLTDGSAPGDWHLVNRFELESILHMGFSNPAVPNTVGSGQWTQSDPFNNVQSAAYWSSTTNAGDTDLAWLIELGGGSVETSDKDGNGYVWCVRGAQ